MIRSVVVTVAAAALLCSALAMLPAGCGSGRVSEPLIGPVMFSDPLVVRGQREFMARCHQCHPNGGAGLALSINDKPLPDWLIRFQIRNGLGRMPAFSEEELSDGAMNAIVAYLNEMHDLAGDAAEPSPAD